MITISIQTATLIPETVVASLQRAVSQGKNQIIACGFYKRKFITLFLT